MKKCKRKKVTSAKRKTCSHVGCTKHVQQGGVCVTHQNISTNLNLSSSSRNTHKAHKRKRVSSVNHSSKKCGLDDCTNEANERGILCNVCDKIVYNTFSETDRQLQMNGHPMASAPGNGSGDDSSDDSSDDDESGAGNDSSNENCRGLGCWL